MVKISEIRDWLYASKIIGFGRSCDLLWFTFQNGESEYHIHSQCWTRIITSGRVLTTSNDIFEPANKDNKDFLWEKFGDSLYDNKLLQLRNFIGLEVRDVKINDVGDIQIFLLCETTIQMMISSSCKLEAWRMFKKNADFHFVCNGKLHIE